MLRHRKPRVCIRYSFAIEVKRFAVDATHAFPGRGQMKAEQLERLKRTKLKAEHDFLKKPRLTLRLTDVKLSFTGRAVSRVAASTPS
jgi:hypothetical protein